MYHDDVVIADYDNDDRMPGWPVTFSRSGDVVAHRVYMSKRNEQYVVIGKKAGKTYTSTLLPVLSADGRGIAYYASDDQDEVEERIVFGEKEFRGYLASTEVALSGDGTTIAYLMENEEEETFLVVGARKSPVSQHAFRPFLNHDGTKVGTVESDGAEKDRKYRVVVGDARGRFYDHMGIPEFGGPDDMVVYQADRGPRSFVVVGNREFNAPGIVGPPVISADGTQIGYGARFGRELWWKVIEVK